MRKGVPKGTPFLCKMNFKFQFIELFGMEICRPFGATAAHRAAMASPGEKLSAGEERAAD